MSFGVRTKICENQQKLGCTVCGKVVGDILSIQQRHQSVWQPCRTLERIAHKSLKEHHTVAHAVETLVNPIEDGTELRITVTLQSLQS